MTDEFPDQIEMENRIRSNEALDESAKRGATEIELRVCVERKNNDNHD